MVKRQQTMEQLLNDGYEWDENHNMGVRNTVDKISIKF
jgi:hypothetical protein